MGKSFFKIQGLHWIGPLRLSAEAELYQHISDKKCTFCIHPESEYFSKWNSLEKMELVSAIFYSVRFIISCLV